MNFLFFLLLFISCKKENIAPQVEENKVTWTECSYNIGDHPCNFTLENEEGEK